MRTIIHLSDLHFGRIDHGLLAPLLAAIKDLKPDVIAVSGDLTQRARSGQFREARAFLDLLPSPKIVVPGNHDVPLHNIFARFLSPLRKYRRYITEDLTPFHADDEIAVLGINTARALTIKHGRIDEEQVASIRACLCPLGDQVTKIIVAHHPLDLPEIYHASKLVTGAQLAMEALAQCGADVILSGHLHISSTSHTAKRYQIAGHSAIVVQAGTATSTRMRGEVNSFNVLRVAGRQIEVVRLAWDAAQLQFAQASLERFQHTPAGWVRLAEEPAQETRH